MGNCNDLFYSDKTEIVTLFRRVSLAQEQMDFAKEKKDGLLDYLKPLMKTSVGFEVKHWLQGSYKNHTLIRPVHMGGEFDVDVGLYLMCNAEKIGLDAYAVKQELRKILRGYADSQPDAELQQSKNCCERVAWTGYFHLDTPLYYYCAETDTCKLATQNDGWVDSDPKALQDWFDTATKDLDRALVRRVIKYLKCWVALKWSGRIEGKLASVAINVLVVNHFNDKGDDDDTFANTMIAINDYLKANNTLPNPVNGDDLLEMDSTQIGVLRERFSKLAHGCSGALALNNKVEESLIWSAIFEHMFPPLREQAEPIEEQNKNLPTVTIPPIIHASLKHKDGRVENHSNEDFHAYKDETVKFYVENKSEFPADGETWWTVRNQGNQAEIKNDMGHTKKCAAHDFVDEHCEYHGPHYMECLVMHKGSVLGLNAVKVTVHGHKRPPRNPPKKRYPKG